MSAALNTMYTESDRKVARIFRRFARDRGWNDHPMVVKCRIAAWRQSRTGPVEDAMVDFERTKGYCTGGRLPLLAVAVVMPAVVWMAYWR